MLEVVEIGVNRNDCDDVVGELVGDVNEGVGTSREIDVLEVERPNDRHDCIGVGMT